MYVWPEILENVRYVHENFWSDRENTSVESEKPETSDVTSPEVGQIVVRECSETFGFYELVASYSVWQAVEHVMRSARYYINKSHHYLVHALQNIGTVTRLS